MQKSKSCALEVRSQKPQGTEEVGREQGHQQGLRKVDRPHREEPQRHAHACRSTAKGSDVHEHDGVELDTNVLSSGSCHTLQAFPPYTLSTHGEEVAFLLL